MDSRLLNRAASEAGAGAPPSISPWLLDPELDRVVEHACALVARPAPWLRWAPTRRRSAGPPATRAARCRDQYGVAVLLIEEDGLMCFRIERRKAPGSAEELLAPRPDQHWLRRWRGLLPGWGER